MTTTRAAPAFPDSGSATRNPDAPSGLVITTEEAPAPRSADLACQPALLKYAANCCAASRALP